MSVITVTINLEENIMESVLMMMTLINFVVSFMIGFVAMEIADSFWKGIFYAFIGCILWLPMYILAMYCVSKLTVN